MEGKQLLFDCKLLKDTKDLSIQRTRGQSYSPTISGVGADTAPRQNRSPNK